MAIRSTIKLASNQQSISELEYYVKNIISEHKICESKFANILISLTEAVNNAIIHGNHNDESKQVTVQCKGDKKGIFFMVVDQGEGFDPLEVVDPTCDEKIECCGGRGVFIINQLADRVEYKNNGNTLEMYFSS